MASDRPRPVGDAASPGGRTHLPVANQRSGQIQQCNLIKPLSTLGKTIIFLIFNFLSWDVAKFQLLIEGSQ